MNAREVAFRVLIDFHTKRADLEQIIDRVFARTYLDGRDKRLAFQISYGVLRNQTYLKYVIEQFMDERLKKELKVSVAVQIALYQILFLDKVPQHAAVSESVELMKLEKSTRKFTGAVNGILRNIIKNRKRVTAIPDTMEKHERLSLEYSHPKWMIDRWMKQFGSAKTKKLLKSNNERPSNYVRWNSTAISRNSFEADISSLTDTAALGLGYRNSYYKLKDGVTASDTDSFIAGACTVQSPSSGWPVALLDCQAGEVVLDISSAPGGKTTHIAELVGKEGKVVACDSNPKRITMVVENSVRLKLADRVIPVVCDGSKSPIGKKFDKILLDAPCSGTGVVQRHPDSRWIRKEVDITRAAELQRKLLDSAAEQLKKGGVLVYSTCSLENEENWGQVESFLEDHPEFELQDASDYVDNKYVSMDRCLVITPHDHNLDGMFGARLVKKR